MRYPLAGVLLLLLAGCGSEKNDAAVTPVSANTKGTYRLVSSTRTVTAQDGSSATFVVYSAGTLRLSDYAYSQAVTNHAPPATNGSYATGNPSNTILTSRHGTFSFTTSLAPQSGLISATYDVSSDYILTLAYDQNDIFNIPAHTDVWVKESDSTHF